MFDFNFKKKSSSRKVSLYCFVGLVSLLALILTSTFYLPLREKVRLVKSNQAQEKLAELENLDLELRRLNSKLDLIEVKSEVDLMNLLEIAYMDLGIEHVRKNKDGLSLKGRSNDKEKIFNLKSQLEKRKFGLVEIEEINLNDGGYNYYIQCDGHGKK